MIEFKGRMAITNTYSGLNAVLLVFGMAGLWFTTESWLAMLFGFIASIHVQSTIANADQIVALLHKDDEVDTKETPK